MTGARILVVDDNPMNLKLACLVLETEGCEVRRAGNAAEALAALEGWQAQLILMDIQMPGMDGLALTRRLKADQARRDIIILAMTAYAMKGDEQRALRAGCDGYIVKPIDTRTLPGIIAGYLDRKLHPAS